MIETNGDCSFGVRPTLGTRTAEDKTFINFNHMYMLYTDHSNIPLRFLLDVLFRRADFMLRVMLSFC